MRNAIAIILSLIIFSSCSTMNFDKGKYKGKEAYKCHRSDELYYVIKSDEFYRVDKEIFVTNKQYNLFHSLNPKDKEEYLEYFKHYGRLNFVLHKYSTVEVEIRNTNKIRILSPNEKLKGYREYR